MSRHGCSFKRERRRCALHKPDTCPGLLLSVRSNEEQHTMGNTPGRTPDADDVIDAIADLPTGKMFYRDSGGDGVPVVFLHAASGNSMMWAYQIPDFTGYRFIAIDYRGLNGKAGACDWSDQIDALVTMLRLPPFHLLGTAAGGGNAFQYALAYREKVRTLVIANSHGNVTDPDYLEMGRRLRPTPQFDALPLDFRELGPSYRAENPEGVERWLALSAASANGQSTDPRFALRPERAVTWARLEALDVPTLLVTGDADLYMPPSVMRMFASRMQDTESAVIPETGHSSYWESPEPFNRTVLTFLAKH
jgi:pimeloyl-ACP methyl ester carboxylesterase